MIPTLHIHLLGDFMLVSGETPVTTVTVPRIQSLLAYLVLHRSAPQDRSHLAFLLWPDSTEAQAHTNLRQLLYHLRQSLPDADQFLHADKQSLQWLPAHADVSWTLDIQDIEQAMVQAEQAEQTQDTTAMRQALEQVLHLYRGDLLPSCYDEWIVPERDRLRQVFLQAAERLIALLEEERAYPAAITVAQQLLRQDPLHEATYRQLMRLYALRGDRAAALRVYHTCVTVLERELGTGPSEVTRAVYESLVQSDTPSETLTGPLTERRTAAPLIGRKTEWRHLQEAWRKAAGGKAHTVILTGEAGIGKTRLAEEMEAWVSRQGMTTASARCYSAVGPLAYAPLTSWLRSDAVFPHLATLDPIWLTEIARLVPEVLQDQPRLLRPAAITEGWQQLRFFEALARALLGARQPLLFLLDDVQWCDQETLHWLHYLLRFATGARLLLLGTVRTEEVLAGHPLLALSEALQRDRLVTEIALKPLTALETTTLAEQLLGQQLDTQQRERFATETEGNPLFVTELVQAGTWQHAGSALSESDHSMPLLTRTASALPPTIQTVLLARLAQLSPLARSLVEVAAVIGRAFAFAVLARASSEPEDAVVRGLDELWQRRIVREQDTGRAESYDFSHGKLREQAYASLHPAHRRLLHRRVAEALAETYAGALDAVSGQIADHYECAGLPVQAISYCQRAGEAAQRLYANAEAINVFERAATLLQACSQEHMQRVEPQWEIAAQVYTSLGDIFVVTGQLQKARHTYERAQSALPSLEPLSTDNTSPVASSSVSPSDQLFIWYARLQRKIASSWNHASTNPHDAVHNHAQQAFQEAERLLMQIAAPSNPAWRNEWVELQFAQIWPLRGSTDDMTVVIEKARPVIEQYGTKEQCELLLYAISTRDLIRTRYIDPVPEKRISFLRNAVAALEQTGDQNKLGTFHFVFGHALLWSNQLDEAEEQFEKALRVAEHIGRAWLQTRSLTFLPFIYRRRGQVEQVRDLLSRAQAIGADHNNRVLTGHRAWVAWRDGNLLAAETYGREAVEETSHEQQEINALQWVGRWPLIGVALAQEKTAEAMNNVRLLLDPAQQQPVEQVKTLLERALQAWDVGQQEEVRALLQQVVPLAENMGYL